MGPKWWLKLIQLEDIAYFGQAEVDKDQGPCGDADVASTVSSDASDTSDGSSDGGSSDRSRQSSSSDFTSDEEDEESEECSSDSDSDPADGSDEIVWAKGARGIWGLGHVFNDKLYFTRDVPAGALQRFTTPAVAKPTAPPAAEPAAKPAAKPAAEPAAKPAAKPPPKFVHEQTHVVRWDRIKKFYCTPVEPKKKK